MGYDLSPRSYGSDLTGTSSRAEAARPVLGPVVRLMNVLSDKAGKIVVARVADRFGMSKSQIAETVGLPLSSLAAKHRSAPKAQARMREMLEIVARVHKWAGGFDQAMAWYRAEPIPAFGDRTAESLVKEGKAWVVRDYLDSLALGGFA